MLPERLTLLLVDDEPYVLDALTNLLAPHFDVVSAPSAAAAQRAFTERDIHLLLADQRMPEMTGVELLEWVRDHYPKTVRLMLTGYADFQETVHAINRGEIFRMILKPWRNEELLLILQNAARSYLLERSVEEQNRELHSLNAELERRVLQRTRELEEAVGQLQQKNSMLEVFALTDPLTSLPNRRAIDGLAKFELRRRVRYPCALALGIVDVDNFKEINSKHLLPGGDHLLTHLAKVLTEACRNSDTVGRIGGDEFMVVAPETPRAGAVPLAERLRALAEKSPASYQGEPILATVSVGFAVVEPPVQASFDQIKHVAAAALNEAKMTGRNRCVIEMLAGEK